MAPAPEALCNTPAISAACHTHFGDLAACAGHRETVHRRRQLARGSFLADAPGRVARAEQAARCEWPL
jgi:hypothetical protein